MTQRLLVIVLVLAAGLGASPAPARADVLLTPFAGVTFGGDTAKRHGVYGVSVAVLAQGILGLELDAALAPNFFDAPSGELADGNVSTVMANLMISSSAVGAPLRPYVSAGAGILHARATSVGNVFDVDDNQFGVDAGLGLITGLRNNVGLRVDVRYFRSLQDTTSGDGLDLALGSLAFWRGTLGLSFRF